MKYKKSSTDRIAVSCIVVLLLITSLLGCGSKSKPSGSDAKSTSVIELKLAHMWPAQNIYGLSIQNFADLVEEKSNGQIKINVFPANGLVAINEMVQAVSDGTADIGLTGSSFAAPQMKELSFLEIPFMFDPANHLELEKQTKPIFDEICKKHGLVYLWSQDGASTGFWTSKPVKEASDLEKLKIRDAGPWMGKGLTKIGAVPVTIPPSDLNVALERKTVDGVHTVWPLVDSYKIYEQVKQATLVPSNGIWMFLIMNQQSWDKLTLEQQKIMTDAGNEASENTVKLVQARKAEFFKLATAEGVTFFDLPVEEIAKLKKMIEPLVQEARTTTLGPLGNKLLDKFVSLQK